MYGNNLLVLSTNPEKLFYREVQSISFSLLPQGLPKGKSTIVIVLGLPNTYYVFVRFS